MVGEWGWTVSPWIAWFLVFAVFVFGAAVQVEFAEPAVPFSMAWGSMSLDQAVGRFQQPETYVGWGISLVCVVVHTFTSAWKVRLGAMVVGFLIPVFAVSPLMVVGMVIGIVVSPLMIFGVLLGTPDGEFYNEGTLMFVACGMWMMVCLVFGWRDALVGWREKKSVSTAD